MILVRIMGFINIHPLPILLLRGAELDATVVHTDVSGHLMLSPGAGIFALSKQKERPLGPILPFQEKSYLKQTIQARNLTAGKLSVEFLKLLLIYPMRFVERKALFP